MNKAKLTATLCVALLLTLAQGAAQAAPRRAQSESDESLFREVKLLVFDKDWRAALKKIDRLREDHPDSPLADQALFYKGECLTGLGGRETEALRAYKDYVRSDEAKPSLVEEAEGRIVDLAFKLYEDGDGGALREIERRLDHDNDVVRYYAAYKLSLVKDKKAAAKAAPVLEDIIETERDSELLDRARIALLRVSPESLRHAEERASRSERPSPSASGKTLQIRIRDGNKREPTLSLSIPFALADLALNALGEDEKAYLRKKGYDLAKIMRELSKSKQSILRLAGEDGSVIEIWID